MNVVTPSCFFEFVFVKCPSSIFTTCHSNHTFQTLSPRKGRLLEAYSTEYRSASLKCVDLPLYIQVYEFSIWTFSSVACWMMNVHLYRSDIGTVFRSAKVSLPQLMPHDCHSPLTYVVFTVTAAAIYMYNLRLCHAVVETAPKVVRWTSNALPADLPAAIHSGVFCSLQKTAQNALLAYLLTFADTYYDSCNEPMVVV